MIRPEPPAKIGDRLTAALRELALTRTWRSAAFWVIVLVNALLIALYLWSRGGGVTTVRIEAADTVAHAYVDGKLALESSLQGRPSGGIGIGLPREERVPSLPKPVGVDSVRVTDTQTGSVLFEDDFDSSRDEGWKIAWGKWRVEDGVFSASTGGLVTAGSDAWTDYVLEVKLRNVEQADIYVRMQNSDNALKFGIQPFRFYRSDANLFVDGAKAGGTQGTRLELDRDQTLRSIIAMLLRPYPVAALMVLGVVALAFVLRVPAVERRAQAVGASVLESANALVFLLAVWALVLLWYINYVVGDHMPHVPDSVLYVFQAKIFASFSLTADAPPVRESFSIFNPHMDQVVDGRWFSHYPFGHPMFLAAGQLFHAVWLVPPLLGAGCVILIYFVGKRVYGAMVGLLAALVLLLSPFFQMTASNFMSHNTAVFTILACLFLYVLPTKRRLVAMFFSGVFLGLLFNMRPLPAVSFIPVLGAFMGYELLRAGPDRLQRLREYAAFGAGGALMLLAYFGYNQATTGDFLKAPYALQGTYSGDTFGFSGGHSLAFGLQNQRQLLALMLLVANGWPMWLGLGLAMLPFVLGTRHRWDYFLLASAVAVAGSNILYKNAAVMHGPRFWYESMPFVMLLTARGAQCLGDSGAAAGDWLAARLRAGPRASSTGVTGAAVVGLVAGLIAFSAYGWMLEQRTAWSGVPFVPAKISQLEGFNFTDDRLLEIADSMDLENALVLVEKCSQWWCLGSVFWTNSPGLDGNIVWAERQGNQDDETLLNHYNGRTLYLADYDRRTIVPVTREELVADIVAGQNPQARQARDEQRRVDLDAIRLALELYLRETGSYPNSEERVQSLCVYPTRDAGCDLIRVLPAIPLDPLGTGTMNGYWYASDGTYFVLVAQQEALRDNEHRCPDRIVRIIGEKADYCVEGRAETDPGGQP